MTAEKIYYQIGDLIMEINSTSLIPVRDLLSSFANFEVENPADDPSCSVELIFGHPAVKLELGVGLKSFTGRLLTDESIVWGDNFRFYELQDSYLASIYLKDQNHYWYMQCSKDFRQAKIFMKEESAERMSSLISWFLMMLYGQSAIWKGVLLIHASVVALEGKAYAFLGKSGTGKSTHSRLWLEAFPNAELLNDDNPAIRIMPDGKCFIYGTPWSGKTACYKSKKVELGGIVRLHQFKENRFERLEGMKAFLALLPSCTGIRWHSKLFRKMNDLVEEIVNEIPIGFLRCLANIDAAIKCQKKTASND